MAGDPQVYISGPAGNGSLVRGEWQATVGYGAFRPAELGRVARSGRYPQIMVVV